MLAPARIVLQQASLTNAALGHENLGPLSEAHGFISARPPIVDLPPPFDAWTEAAAALPELCDTLRLRRALDALPRLEPSPERLPDRYLMRAASVIGLLVQAYYNIEAIPPAREPAALVDAWRTLAWRLDRPRWTMSTNDFVFHNWRLVDPGDPDPMRVENLRLLTSVWDNTGVEVFMLVVLEMLARSAPLVGAIVRAQEAVLAHDDSALKAELVRITDTTNHITFDSLLKANPNRHCGGRYVDPVVWTKMFALLPLPLREGVHNASGVETPSFHLMDEFFERRSYGTHLGHEALAFRASFPHHWRRLLVAVREVSVAAYIGRSHDRELRGLFRGALEAYQGANGVLARHRLKAYTYMDAAFKTGRASTITGFSGLFKDRAWDTVDTSFEESRVERHDQYPAEAHFARIEGVSEVAVGPGATVRRVVFDVRGLGIRYQPGDRLAVIPENRPEVVARALAALEASGEERIPLTRRWRLAMATRDGFADAEALPLANLLAFGQLRPVEREVAKRLHGLVKAEGLRRIIEARTEDQWELWDLLELLKRGGFSPARLLTALPGEPHHIANIVPPLAHRLYSISSAPVDPQAPADTIELTVGQLTYESVESPTSRREERQGTASSFLCNPPGEGERSVAIRVVHPPRFSLPRDPGAPIVMFAAGTGIAPFRGFLQARARGGGDGGGENLLFFGVRDVDSILYRRELEALQAAGHLEVEIALSREDVRPRFDAEAGILRMERVAGGRARIDERMREPAIAARLRELLRPIDEGGRGAALYVCGRATFAASVMAALVDVLGEGATAAAAQEDGYRAVYRMIGEDRYLQDIFTTYTGSMVEQSRHVDASALVLRNDPEKGLWMAIGGRVYDVTRFAEMHPGGAKIIRSYAGMDATHAYQKVEHHLNSEIHAMLSMYEIGVMRRLDFRRQWTVTAGDKGLEFAFVEALFTRWLRSAYLLVEIENAFAVEVSLNHEELIPRRGGEAAPPGSAYRLQFQIQAHHRFVNQTLPYLAEELGRLWWQVASAADNSLDVRWLQLEIARVRAGVDAPEASAWTEELQRRSADLDPASLAAWHEHVLRLQAVDAALMSDAKAALVRGLAAFEAHPEVDTLALAGPTLIDALRSLGGLLRGYYRRLAHERASLR